MAAASTMAACCFTQSVSVSRYHHQRTPHAAGGSSVRPALAIRSRTCISALYGEGVRTQRRSHCFSQSGSALRVGQASPRSIAGPRPVISMDGAVIQFIRGIDEQTVPEVKLTRSKDGTNGTATFMFDQPSVFDSSRELGDITGLYLIDDEGIIQSVDVSAKFVNGKPAKIEARHIMRNVRDWDRFMRFMERYADKYNLGFTKK